jgi:hypothetical protein
VRSSFRIRVVVMALLVLGAGLAVLGCGTGEVASAPDATTSTGPRVTVPKGDTMARAIGQIAALYGLPKSAVSRSTGPTTTSPADVWVAWDGGSAVVDTDTGRVRVVLASREVSYPATNPSESDLDLAVSHVLELLGWDDAALAAEGFTAGETKTVDHGAGPEYTRTWVGHDEQGLTNGGLIQVALYAQNGRLVSFFYNDGPRAAASPAAISKDDAIQIALNVVGDNPPVDPTTSDTLPGGSTTSGPPLGITVTSAELIHSDAPGITGGKAMLVWVVKLGGYTRSGHLHAQVYVDALTGKVLSETY